MSRWTAECATVFCQLEMLSGQYRANYYVVNGALIVPMLGGPEDDAAQPILEGLYPDRTVVPVESTAIAWDGGGVGCITQQQPAGRLAR